MGKGRGISSGIAEREKAMLSQILQGLEPAVVSACVAVLTALIGIIAAALVKFIEAKKDALREKVGADRYDAQLAVARECWGIVEEYFRLHPTLTKTAQAAAELFAEELRKSYPDLANELVDHLRQAVAGEKNAGRPSKT